jgi:hypothetical protein
MPEQELQEQRDVLIRRSPRPLRLTIGGVGVELRAEAPDWDAEPVYQPFLDGSGETAVELHVNVAPRPPAGWNRVRYAAAGPRSGSRLWGVRPSGDGFLVAVKGPTRATTPARAARVDRAWTRGDLFVRHDARHSERARFPLGFPLDVVLFASALAHRGGVVAHASALERDGRGVVFTGPSGAGKTTAARLLQRRGFHVLNDERVVLRVEAGQLAVHGTPWHGALGVVSAGSAPVAAIFFIEHADRTSAVALRPPEAARRLVPRCRLPFWDVGAMQSLLATVDATVRLTPCLALGVRPDDSLGDLVERFAS